jgi:DNA-binding LytR/AlgR family response regulator
MTQYNCLVCDDEPVARRVIKSHIEQMPQLALAGECENGLEAIAFLKKNTVDLLFLDINMPMLDGLTFLKTLKTRPKTILTTAYSEHALDAFDLDVADYLVKPVPFERFLRAVLRATEGATATTESEPTAAAAAAHPEHMIVRFGRTLHRIRYADILYLESQANVVKIVTTTQTLRTYQTLAAVERELPAYMFVRTHRSFLVNRHQVSTLDGLSIVFGENERVPIAEAMRTEVVALLGFG